jgi:3-oxoacyl-[acyl-carrier-protein] synthase II
MSVQSLKRRAVFTGIGVVSPIGLDLETFWSALIQGRSGVRRLQAFDPSPLPVQIGGEVDGFDVKNFVDKKDRKRLGPAARGFQFMVAAAQMAVTDSKIDKAALDPTRFGVYLGSSTLPGELAELGPAAQVSTDIPSARVDFRKWGELGLPLIPPMWMLNHIPNIMSCHVSILHNAQGASNTITQTDVAALLAVGEALRALNRGKGDVMLVGGADNQSIPVNMVRHTKFLSMSRRNDAPRQACRPFDRDRDGTVQGEGAGCLVLEEAEHARRRGAPIYAEVLGFASGVDRARDGKGLARVIRTALAQAQITPDQLDHVNAQGYGTIVEDRWEARGIQEALGGVPVVALKGYFGNLGAASGAAELAATLLALKNGQVPATINCEHPDCPVTIAQSTRPLAKPHALKISFTELGQCAALVLRKGD